MRVNDPEHSSGQMPENDYELEMYTLAARLGRLLPGCHNIGELLKQMHNIGWLLLRDQNCAIKVLARSIDRLTIELEVAVRREKDAAKKRRLRRKKTGKKLNVSGPQFTIRITNCQLLQLFLFQECEVVENNKETTTIEKSLFQGSEYSGLYDDIVMYRYLKRLVMLYIEGSRIHFTRTVVGQLHFLYHTEDNKDACEYYSIILDTSGLTRHRDGPLTTEESKREIEKHSKYLIQELNKRFTHHIARDKHCLLQKAVSDRHCVSPQKKKSVEEIVWRNDSHEWMNFVKESLRSLNLHLHETVPDRRDEVRLTTELSDEKTERLGRIQIFSMLNQETFESWWSAKEGVLDWGAYQMNYWKNLADHLRLPKFSVPNQQSRTSGQLVLPHSSPTSASGSFLDPVMLSKGHGPDPDFFQVPDLSAADLRKVREDLERLSRQRKYAATRELIVLRNGREDARIQLDHEANNTKIIPVSDGDLLLLHSEEDGMIVPFGSYRFSADEVTFSPVIFRLEGGQRVSISLRSLPDEGDETIEAEVAITYHFPPLNWFAAIKARWSEMIRRLRIAFSITGESELEPVQLTLTTPSRLGVLYSRLIGAGALVLVLLILVWIFRTPATPPIVKTGPDLNSERRIDPEPLPTLDIVVQGNAYTFPDDAVKQVSGLVFHSSHGKSEELVFNDGAYIIKVEKYEQPAGFPLLKTHKKLFDDLLWKQRIPAPLVEIPKSPDSRVTAGPASNDRLTVKLLAPVGTMVRQVRPQFIWKMLPSIRQYELSVTDESGRAFITVKVAGNRWMADQDLPRGVKLLWTVSSIEDNTAYSDSTPFEILPEDKLKQLSEQESYYQRSPLMRAILQIQYGLLDEAEKELDTLLKSNRQSAPFEAKVADLKAQLRLLRD